MTKTRSVRLAVIALAGLLAAAAAAAQHTPLFRPEDLGELEAPDRDEWQRPDKIMDALGVGEASVVADLGAGSGWFTIRLADRVGPNGKVFAEDIQRPMIQAIKVRVDRMGLKDRSPPCSERRTTRTFRSPLMRSSSSTRSTKWRTPSCCYALSRSRLKPKGRIGIVKHTKDGGGPGPAMDERVDPEIVIRDARAAGLVLRSRETFLKYQYMLVFEHPRIMIAAPRFFSEYQALVNARARSAGRR